jgi:hypothetical protein
MRAIAGFRVILLVSLMALAAAHARAEEATDPDERAISQLSLTDVVLSVLSLRMDLDRYDTRDLGTLSGQYELFYREVMSACGTAGKAQAEPALCPGHSLSESFLRYAQSDSRICARPAGDACSKPRYEAEAMRAELLELVKARYRGASKPRAVNGVMGRDVWTAAAH